MKVVHLPFSYFPDPAAGTEIYVASLARELRTRGVVSVIASPVRGGRPERYVHDDVTVHRYGQEAEPRLDDLYGEGSRQAAAAFAEILRDERPDVVHMHALTYGISLRLARAARAQGIPVVFTHHATTVSCQRGTLLRNGDEVCDGALIVRRCTACTLRHHGLPGLLSDAVSLLPPALVAPITRAGKGGGAWTALQMPELMRVRHDAFRGLMREVDVVVAVSDWVRELLVRNGVPASKIVLSRQGVAASHPTARAPSAVRAAGSPVRALLLGRLDPTKGAHVVVEALRAAPSLAMTLDIYGISQDSAHDRYGARVRELAGGDARIRFLPPVPSAEVAATLARYDVLLVPSQYLETGPLVVLEAFAAGIPVLGSRLGGIVERVREGIDGLLVEAASVEGWRAAFERIAGDPALLERLRGGVSAPRTMSQVADDMMAVYERVAPAPLPEPVTSP